MSRRPLSQAHFASTGSRKQTIRPMTRTPVACSSSSAWRASYLADAVAPVAVASGTALA